VGKRIGNSERWREWAAALSRRGTVARRREPLAFRWLRPASGIGRRFQPANVVSQHFAVHLAIPCSVRMEFTPAQALPGEARPQSTSPFQAGSATADRRVTLPHLERSEHSTAELTVVRTSAFIRLVTERTRRVEERVPARELVVARQAPAEPRESGKEPGRTPSGWMSEPAAAAGWNRPMPAPPAASVDQIADNVMRLLDRRIGAWRERMGRM